MKSMAFLIAMLVSPIHAEEIPLKSVWASRMPRTANIRDLEPRTDRGRYGPIMRKIYSAIIFPRDEKKVADRGFAVEGAGLDALKKAKAVLVDGGKRPETLKAGEITLVFYSHASGVYVYLKKVTRDRNTITLSYCFASHMSREVTAHFALIPLGVLAPGKYEVKLDQLFVDYSAIMRPPYPKDRAPEESVRRTVSQPFTFQVK